jgi:hypothetical protein
MARYSRKIAAQSGTSELAIQRQMSDYALRDVTAQSYAANVLGNFGRYVLQPTGLDVIFRVPIDSVERRPDPPDASSILVVVITALMYFPVLALAVLGILLVRRVPEVAQLVALLAAVLGGALMSQPFVHVASPRYWPVFAPMMSLAAVGLLVRPDPAGSSVWLHRLRAAAAVGWVVVIIGVVLVAVR